MNLQAYLGEGHDCDCGRRHSTIIEHIDVSAGALRRVAPWITDKGFRNLLMVGDVHTYEVAGKLLLPLLREAGLAVTVLTLPDEALVANEYAIGRLITAFTPDMDLIVSVGSGTLNDLCKFCAFRVGKPSLNVGTAPSMDGFAAEGAAMTLGGLKISPQTCCPIAIFCDVDILKEAPMAMIASGLSDMLGKYNCLCEWRTSQIVTGEYFCLKIVEMVEKALAQCVDSSAKLPERDPAAIAALTEGLILSGIAMSYVNSSRPAGGGEHHLSHFWEMRFLAEKKPAVLHGEKVGVGTLATVRAFQWLTERTPDWDAAMRQSEAFDENAWQEAMRQSFGAAAENLITAPGIRVKFDKTAHSKRVEALKAHWPALQAMWKACLPDIRTLEAVMNRVGAPTRPAQLGVTDTMFDTSVRMAAYGRERYTLHQLLWDVALQEDALALLKGFLCDHTGFLKQVRCFVLDMDGTIYLGGRLFPFTKPFLEAVTRSGRDYVFFTNNSSQNRETYLAKLAGMGLHTPPAKMLTSNQVIIRYLQTEHPGKRVYLLGTPPLIEDFKAAGIPLDDQAPDIVILGFDKTLTYEKVNRACAFIRAGKPVFGVHPDRNCPVEDGGMMPDCAAIAAMIEASTGVKIPFLGKPSPLALAHICEQTGFAPAEIAFVGDRLYTDIAVAAGNDSHAVLVLTGESTAQDAAASPYRPDLVVSSLEALGELL